MTTTKVTQKQAEAVLAAAAEWLGKKGLGTLICPDGRDLDIVGDHKDDGSECPNLKVGPAPTGKDAAYRALGPDLVLDWDWPGEPTPTILLEGGPGEWAYDSSPAIQRALDAKGIKVYVEPFACYALCIYPA